MGKGPQLLTISILLATSGDSARYICSTLESIHAASATAPATMSMAWRSVPENTLKNFISKQQFQEKTYNEIDYDQNASYPKGLQPKLVQPECRYLYDLWPDLL